MLSPTLFFDAIVLGGLLVMSIMGGIFAGKPNNDRITKVFFSLIALLVIWATLFFVFYLVIGLGADAIGVSLKDRSLMWISRIPTFGAVLFFYTRWVLEEYRSPKLAPGFVAGRLKSFSGRGKFQ